MTDTKDIVSSNKSDLIASVGKSVVGAVPFVGPLLSELVDSLIPNQRVDRLTKYVTELERRLSNTEEQNLRLKVQNEEYLTLIEDGYIYASRAITDERRFYIASIVARGLTHEEVDVNSSKYLLRLLSELNDTEVIWLRFHLDPTIGGDRDFREKHANVLEPARAYIGAPVSELNKSALQDSYKDHLERLGLIRSHIRIDHETGMPNFDSISGKPEVSYRDITQLGRMLLHQVGIMDEERS